MGFASLQSPWAYTPGVRAGAECGAAALTPLGATPQTPFSKIIWVYLQSGDCCENATASACRKSMFFQKKCLFSIPIRTLCGLCVLQSLWAFYLGILAETPNPFPSVKGCVCFVGSASCRAFGHTRQASLPGLSVGLPPSPSKDACSQSHIVAARRSDTND